MWGLCGVAAGLHSFDIFLYCFVTAHAIVPNSCGQPAFGPSMSLCQEVYDWLVGYDARIRELWVLFDWCLELPIEIPLHLATLIRY